jgi:hypothetical protein
MTRARSWAADAPAAALLLLVLGGPAGAGPASPHGRGDACSTCHASPAGGAFVRGSIVDTCNSCHDDRSHAVGMRPSRATVPASWPLTEGRLSCETCHDEPACEGDGVDKANPRFFRDGPYSTLGGLCATCHPATALATRNPHDEMRAQAPAEAAGTCALCHASVPGREGTAIAPASIPGPVICAGCHATTRHAGLEEHMQPLSASMASRALAAGLPLDAGSRVSCLTCHDPHPADVTAASAGKREWPGVAVVPDSWWTSVLGPSIAARSGGETGAVRTSSDLLRLTLADGALCVACHGSGDAQ